MQAQKIMTYLKKAMDEFWECLQPKELIRVLKDYVPANKKKINKICVNLLFVFVRTGKPSTADTHK
jgi:hypothetical protein